jgi:DNA-binding SARP family transcriptional activator/tetratricopeptide (TPR) repeat protein
LAAIPTEFGVLGDVEARANGQVIEIGPARQRCVLAALLVDANQPVPADQLVDRVWGEHAPQRSLETLYSYLSRLRGVLAIGHGATLIRRSGGYVLDVGTEAVDLHRFRLLVARARTVSEEEQALALLSEALHLWRGTAFGRLDTPWVNAVRHVVDAERVAAEADLTDLRLRHGEHCALLGDLEAQANQHPLDERVAGQLMVALYLSGRTGDALEHYRHVRATLAAELGIDPGTALHTLHQRILRADPGLVAPTAIRRYLRTPSGRASVPRELPAEVSSFVGRSEELTMLNAVMSADERAVPIVALSGTAGIGKTTLALHWAHQVAQRFPDGQLYVNLRGFDDASTLGAAVVLRRFIAALGVPADQIPSALDARAAQFRSVLAGKRMLVFLDNARDLEHVQPLLPGTAGSMAIVTSRTSLCGLAAATGAHHIALDVLSPADARSLLAARVGSEVVAAQPEPIDEIIIRCARLPLALAIASARMVGDPARLAAELRAHGDPLDALHLPETSVATVLSWSYRVLSAAAARLFRLIGTQPGPDLTECAAASLAWLQPFQARRCLRELVDANLLVERYPGRYTCHDLLRAYAAHQARATDAEADRLAALERLIDHYVHTAYTADRLVYPTRPPITLPDALPGVVVSEVPDSAAAWAWLAAEHDNVLAALDLAVRHEWRMTAWRLAWATSTLHQRQGHPQDLYRAWRSALAVLHESDPVPMHVVALREIAEACARMGHFPEAFRCLHEAVGLVEQDQWQAERAATLRTLARTHGRNGDDRAAYRYASQSLAIYRRLKMPDLVASAANAVGWYAARIGAHQKASSNLELALKTARERGDRLVEGNTLHSMGYLAQQMGHHDRAVALLRECLGVAYANGDTHSQATALRDLGNSLAALGQSENAEEHWRRALPLLDSQARQSEAAQLRATLGPATITPLDVAAAGA